MLNIPKNEYYSDYKVVILNFELFEFYNEMFDKKLMAFDSWKYDYRHNRSNGSLMNCTLIEFYMKDQGHTK